MCSKLSLKDLTDEINERMKKSRPLVAQLIKKEMEVLERIKVQQISFIE